MIEFSNMRENQIAFVSYLRSVDGSRISRASEFAGLQEQQLLHCE